MVPLHSVYQASSYEPGLAMLALCLQTFAYSNMLFIFEMACTAANKKHSNGPTMWKMVLAK